MRVIIKPRLILALLIITLTACLHSGQPVTPPEEPALFDAQDLLGASSSTLLSETELPSRDLANEEINLEAGDPDGVAPDDGQLSSQAVLAGVDGYLVYYRTDGTRYQIFVHDQSTDVRTRIYNGDTEVQSVAVNAEGDLVAASIKIDGSFDIYLFNLITNQTSNLTSSPGTNETDVSMSADDTVIVYAKPNGNGISKVNICRYDRTADSCAVTVVRSGRNQTQPSVSGNGNYIAFVNELNNDRERILLYDVAADTLTTVVTHPDPISHPSVSDDGNTVMYLRERTGAAKPFQIRIKNLTSNQLRTELASVDPLLHPHLTADADYFAFGLDTGDTQQARTRSINTDQWARAAAGTTWRHGAVVWQKPVACNSPETPLSIPDIALEQAVRNELQKQSGVITCGDMTGLTSLSALGEGISDLTALRHANNLQHLDLSNNSLTHLSSLSQLTNLQSLKLNSNDISDISPLRNLINLQYLNLNANNISGVNPLASLTSLQTLYLYKNNVTNLSPLGDLTELQNLDLGKNNVTNPSPLGDLTNLQILFLDDNRINSIAALGRLVNLQGLYLNNNNISNVSPLINLTSLQSLFLSGNNITSVSSLSELIYLQSLDLSGNLITDIQALFNNWGLGSGDFVALSFNCLDPDTTPDSTNISMLESMGVDISIYPQRTHGCP